MLGSELKVFISLLVAAAQWNYSYYTPLQIPNNLLLLRFTMTAPPASSNFFLYVYLRNSRRECLILSAFYSIELYETKNKSFSEEDLG